MKCLNIENEVREMNGLLVKLDIFHLSFLYKNYKTFVRLR